MAYDSENHYFAFRCFDTESDKIKSAVSARDNVGSDDWVCINLDSFFDQQSLYAFYVNPAGIQMDSRFAAGKEDYGVDMVWYRAGQMDTLGCGTLNRASVVGSQREIEFKVKLRF